MKSAYNIVLTTQELELLGRILPDHPFKLVAPLIENINRQIQEQLKEEHNE